MTSLPRREASYGMNKISQKKQQNAHTHTHTYQMHQISGQQTKFFLTIYAFMHLCIIISAVLSILISCFTFYHYINHWFIHLLCIFCMMNVVRRCQGNIVLRNISDVTERVHLHHPREKSSPFQKEYKKEIFNLVSPHFNFWFAIEKCYYVPVLTGCPNNSK